MEQIKNTGSTGRQGKKTQGTQDENRTDMGETDKPTWNNTGLTTQGAIN